MANIFDQFDAAPATSAPASATPAYVPGPDDAPPLNALGSAKSAKGNGASIKQLVTQQAGGGNIFDQFDAPFTPDMQPAQDTATDIVKSAGAGLAEGANSVAATAGDVSHGLDYAISYLGAKAAEKLGMLPPGETADSFLKAAQDAKLPPSPIEPNLPGSQDLQNIEEKATGPFHEPTTTAGKYARSIASVVPAVASGPASVVRKGAQAVLGGGLGEGLGQATEGTALEGPARVVGTILGTGAPSVTKLRVPSATKHAMHGITPATVDKADKIMQQGLKLPVPVKLTWDEAIAAATGGETSMTSLRRVAENSEGGGALRELAAARPKQVENSGAKTFETALPKGAKTNPVETGLKVNKASDELLKRDERLRTNKTAPLYKAANKQPVKPDDVNALIKDMDKAIAKDTTKTIAPAIYKLRQRIIASQGKPGVAATPGTPATRTPVTGPNGKTIRYNATPATQGTPAVAPVPAQPATDINNLNRARRVTREELDMPLGSGQEPLTKEQAASVAPFLQRLKSIMETTSPLFKAGNQRYAAMTKRIVEPQAAGPLGKLAATEDVGKQGAALLPTNPEVNSEKVVREAVQRLASRDPSAAEGLIHNQIRKVFNEATQDNMGGANPKGGAKFVAALLGNSQQAKNWRAAVEALPDGKTRWAGIQKFTEVMRAVGHAPAQGSMTAFNKEIIEALKEKSLTKLLFHTKAALIHYAERLRLGHNTEKVARILTDPHSVGLLRDMAKAHPGSSKAEHLAIRLILRGEAGKSKNENPQNK